jgi:hypothetical protein
MDARIGALESDFKDFFVKIPSAPLAAGRLGGLLV